MSVAAKVGKVGKVGERPSNIGRITRDQRDKAVRAAQLKVVISAAKRELEAIDRELEPLLGDGIEELWFGRRLVAKLKDTGGRRFRQDEFKVDHPRLFERYVKFRPTWKIDYVVGVGELVVVEGGEEGEVAEG